MSLRKILLVEDDYLIQKIIAKHLTKMGYAVSAFDNGLEAYTFFSSLEEKPDLIITDIMLPYLDGTELMAKVKADVKEFPIIAITAMEANQISYKTDERFDRIFLKPFNLKELEEAIQEILVS
jgi:DNA-binding response OmpR family regulator